MPGKKKPKSARTRSLDDDLPRGLAQGDEPDSSLERSVNSAEPVPKEQGKRQKKDKAQGAKNSKSVSSSSAVGERPAAADPKEVLPAGGGDLGNEADREPGGRAKAPAGDEPFRLPPPARDGSPPEGGGAVVERQTRPAGAGQSPGREEPAGPPPGGDLDDDEIVAGSSSDGQSANGDPADDKNGKKKHKRNSRKINKSRNVKTAPSTPESEDHRPPRHAESTSNLELTASYGKRLGVKGIENTENVKPPDKKATANMRKSRNEKFHKLFKNIPEKEKVLKSYLCAYVGDILLQGYFYILPSYFCFYTKILGHEKQLEIPVSEVLNITREKTALIIPNAIGVLTKKDKYVFGSLMSRDSTYRLMCTVWKKKIPNAQVTDLKATDSDSSTEQDYIVARDDLSSLDDEAIPSSATASDLSEGSVCSGCGLPPIEHDRKCPRWDVPRPPDVATEAALYNGTIPGKAVPPGAADQHEPGTHRSHHAKQRHKQHLSTSVAGTADLRYRNSQTGALLITCLIISVALVLLAAFMSYKILILQTQIDITNQLLDPSLSRFVHSQKLYSDLYYLNDRYHTSTIERFHSVLEANIELLSQVHASLFSLHKTSNLSGQQQQSCQEPDGYCPDNS